MTNMENKTSEPNKDTFDEIFARTIQKAKQICETTVLGQPYPRNGQSYCNATFDGYSCWNFTKAGTRIYGTCPKFFVHRFGHTDARPFKDCNPDGTWYRHPESNKTWSDYTPCTDTTSIRRAQNIVNIYFGGYTLSVISLIMALFIFCFYRQLKCPRVSIHKNMFLSYILAGVLWVIYYATTSLQPHVLVESPMWCQMLHVFAQYATCSNYGWMFCEGLYLHTILIHAFVNESNILTICYIVGWVVPFIQTIIYFIVRMSIQPINVMCWHGQSNIHWILLAPIIVELMLNTLFLINILRILCRKRIAMNQPDTLPIRRSLRATLILVPLLGIQYFAVPFRPLGKEELIHVYNIFSAVLVSFQGFVVALLFCFCNEEVRFLLKKQFGSQFQRKLSRTDTVRSTLHSLIPNSHMFGRTRFSSGNIEHKPESEGESKKPRDEPKACEHEDVFTASVV